MPDYINGQPVLPDCMRCKDKSAKVHFSVPSTEVSLSGKRRDEGGGGVRGRGERVTGEWQAIEMKIFDRSH